jgi:hypothetical protein
VHSDIPTRASRGVVAAIVVVALAFSNAHVPAGADPTPAATSSPPPGNAIVDIDEKVADNQHFIDEAGPDAIAALKLGNDADDAAKAAQAFNTQSLDSIKSGFDATETVVNAIAAAPTELIPVGDAPTQELWTVIDHDTAAAAAAMTKLGQSQPAPNANACEKLHDALAQLDLAGDAITAASAAPADVLEYIKHLFARAQDSEAGAALEAQLKNELDPDFFSMSNAVAGAAAANQLIVDSAYVIKDQESKANCGEFAGQFDEVMNVTFLTKANTEWWKYEADVRGTVHLRYTYADSKNAPEPVVGDIRGAATKFTVWTDPFNSPPGEKFIGGSLVDKQESAPDPQPQLALQSAATLMGQPATFDIPVTGTITGNTLSLALGDADKDFDPDAIQSTTTFVISSPYTMYRPVKTSYKLPYKDVHFMLAHFFPATWTVTEQGATQSLSIFGAKDLPGNQNDAKYEFHATICDPGCV